ncbi:MAG TPA: asparagine synthase (glutamine-hydrolyzing) [Deltaproteobacteria bacterium]|nr:asparagine synthase (glutamine-hydrolyzing) [Deltaproteobacteria bacterium]
MCGIAGIYHLNKKTYPHLERHLDVMGNVLKHRGPDDQGKFLHPNRHLGFAHRRLSIIDLETGDQPMTDNAGHTICYNGEIYNYKELRKEFSEFHFRTTSDTEAILAAYNRWGQDCPNRLRGMFAFALWDEAQQIMFCARDRFGVKPFYYTIINGVFLFASEAKALLPFLPNIRTNADALKDYLAFQLCLDGKTLFEGIHELPPGHVLIIKNGNVEVKRYWEVYYKPDFDHTPRYFTEKLRALLDDSIRMHIRSDVPIGAYLSGGLDSSAVTSLAVKQRGDGDDFLAFTGKFCLGELYDESAYARALARESGIALHEVEITSEDFLNSIRQIIYYLDYPVAGPGSFPQFHVSKLAADHRKVVLGGQGADEIFGGYVRYLLAYFEQCIKGAIDGTLHNGNFIVTYESIIPNLVALQNYKPMIKEFWRDGLFEALDKRYYRLINRAPSLEKEVNWEILGDYSPYETFNAIFHGKNVEKESYLDMMTHFDFKTLLPALLQVEDRMSMAHGLESRVPFLDHPIVEFAATMPADIKFKDGTLKKILLDAVRDDLPGIITSRKNKMGFPVPLNEWLQGELKEFIFDIFTSQKAKQRPYFNHKEILNSLQNEPKFGRKLWGLLSLELWHQEFHDKQLHYSSLCEKGVQE